MSERTERAIAFLDTNFCLHYPNGDQINWAKAFDAKTVTVVVCLGVFDELEQIKTDKRMGKRAAWWLKKCKEAMKAPVRINSGDLEFFITESASDSKSDSIGDENIMVQAIVHKRKNQGVPFFFVTDDGSFGIRLALKGLGVKDPNELAERIKDERTEAEKEVEKLKKEVNELRERQPELQLRVQANNATVIDNGVLEFELVKPMLGQRHKNIEKFLGLHLSVYDDAMKETHFGGKKAQLQTWCDNQDTIEDESARTITFLIQLENSGKANAEGVEMIATYQADVMATTAAGTLRGYRELPKPLPKVTQEQYYPNTDTYVDKLKLLPNAEVVPFNLHEAKNSWNGKGLHAVIGTITWPIDIIKHGRKNDFELISITFREWESVKPFTLNVELHVDKPPVKKFVNVVLKPKVVSKRSDL